MVARTPYRIKVRNITNKPQTLESADGDTLLIGEGREVAVDPKFLWQQPDRKYFKVTNPPTDDMPPPRKPTQAQVHRMAQVREQTLREGRRLMSRRRLDTLLHAAGISPFREEKVLDREVRNQKPENALPSPDKG